MTRTSPIGLIGVAALALIATPVFADETPAERFGALNGSVAGSAQSYDMAVTKLTGDDLDDKIVQSSTDVATRNISAGTQALATNLGVNPDEFSRAELAKMFIGRYD